MKSFCRAAFLTAVFFILTLPLSAQGRAKPAGDTTRSASETIRVGLETSEVFTTVRVQSFSGNWRLTFQPGNQSPKTVGTTLASESASTPVATVSELLVEGEDASLMLVPKGIVARLSTEKDLEKGYKKVIIEGGELLSIEIPGHPPTILQGRIEISNNGNSLTLVNIVNMHQFIVSCVSKMLLSNEPEVIKAMVIVVRTRLHHLKEHATHSDSDYEVCDTDHCLPFSGCGYNRELVDILTTMTGNLSLTHKGKIIMPRFHHTCGGRISSAKDVYGVDNEPYHPAHDDIFEGKGSENCFHSPGFHWTIELQKFDILDFLSVAYAAGADRIYASWEPEKVDANGRIFQVLLRGRKPKSVPGIDFLQKLQSHFGPNSVKSMKFNMDILKRTIIFRGMGNGDGVGMCLYGADGLAKKSVKYDQILKFYYPGTELK